MSRLANYFCQIFKAVKMLILNSLIYIGFPFDEQFNLPANVARKNACTGQQIQLDLQAVC
jgi:hypothetical protein